MPEEQFTHKIFVIILRDIIGLIGWKKELRCVIGTGVTLFTLVLHINCTDLSQSESSIFSCILLFTKLLFFVW